MVLTHDEKINCRFSILNKLEGGKGMEVEEILYQEVDNECALCGLKGVENLTIHHIDGKKDNKEYDNQIVICRNCHIKHNKGIGTSTDDIKIRKKQLIYSTLTAFGVSALKVAYRNGFGIGSNPYMLHHIVDMGYLQQEGDTIGWITSDDGKHEVPNMAFYIITDKGKHLHDKWFKQKKSSIKTFSNSF